MHRKLFFRICVSAACVLAAPCASSQSAPASLKAAIDAAWQRSPQARNLQARRGEALAGREAAQSWIAGSPAIGLVQRSGRWTNQNGERESEVSLSAPVWLPGQKAARQALAQRGADDLEAQIVHAQWTIAGEVRERLWAVAAARAALTESQDHQHHLVELAEEVERRVNAGDLARTDGLLAQQQVLAANGEIAAAQVRVNEALSRYRTLTGQADIPSPVPEAVATAIREPHPGLLVARAAFEHGQAALNVANAVRSDPLTVGLSMRREQGAIAANASRSLGIAVQIPLGTNARNRPLEAAAQTKIETATAEMAQAESLLRAGIELARGQLAASQQALSAAASRAALTREHAELIGKAFRLGERGLADLLRAEALLHEAEISERQQQVAVGLAHARLNHALGVIP